jgi:HAD superfamily hydrolase (TIGR01484 family)
MLNSSPLTADKLTDIRLIATDVDGTLTQNDKFTPELLQAIDLINAKGVKLLLVTGRSAGWVSALNNYLPVAGAIAENGGLFFNESGEFDFLTKIKSISEHRERLANVFWELQERYPQIEESIDNQFRITDWTFDVAGVNSAELWEIASQCEQWGWGFTYSTVQCHIKPLKQDKAQGILQVLKQHFSPLQTAQILTVGDSPNDASMFDRQLFSNSVGVANIQHYLDKIAHQPQYLTKLSEVAGFCEIVDLLSNKAESNLNKLT